MADYDKEAKIYDDVHNSEFMGDTTFYLHEAKKARGKVLEVGCGTGRIYLRLLEAGVDAYGIDISRGMLQKLRANAHAKGLAEKIFLANAKNFRLPHKFELIIVPFRAFLHLLTMDDQLAALKTMRAHLAPGGKLMLNFFYPDPEFISKNYHKGKLRKSVVNGIERYDETFFIDEPNQIAQCKSTFKRKGKKPTKGHFRLAFIYKREFELLLRLAGFSKWRVYGGFKKEELKTSKQEMVWVIER